MLVLETFLVMVHRMPGFTRENRSGALHNRMVRRPLEWKGPTLQRRPTIAANRDIQTILTSTRRVGGSGTIPVVAMSDTTSTIPGSMGGSGVALAATMSGG